MLISSPKAEEWEVEDQMLRNKHLIVKYLHWLDVQRLSRLNSAIRRVLSSDAVDVISLAKHLF